MANNIQYHMRYLMDLAAAISLSIDGLFALKIWQIFLNDALETEMGKGRGVYQQHPHYLPNYP